MAIPGLNIFMNERLILNGVLNTYYFVKAFSALKITLVYTTGNIFWIKYLNVLGPDPAVASTSW
jgi:hypothetical protein